MNQHALAAIRQKYLLEKALYSFPEMLKLLSIKKTTAYVLINKGHLHPKKILGKTVFFADDLAAFLERVNQGGVNA